MKLLRILTGLHAGAQLRLDQGAYVVGSDAGGDVQITDWKHAPIRLTFQEGQPMTVASVTSDAAGALEMPALEDLMPRRFKDVVLCIGPADTAWPSDIKLLEKLVRADARPKKSRRSLFERRSVSVWIACATVCAALLSSFVLVAGRGNAHARVPEVPLQVKVQRAVQAVGAPGVSVKASEGRVIVEGLAADGATAARLRTALLPFGTTLVVHRYASAEDMAQSITDALATPGVSVRYRGDGVFLVDGRSMDLDKLRAEARRIAGDLGPLVQRIEFAVAEMPTPERVPIGSMLANEDIRYVQTRDGTKHLFLGPTVASAQDRAAITSLPR